MLPPRPPFSEAVYARDPKEDGACFGALSDPSLGKRTLAALMRIEDRIAAGVTLLGEIRDALRGAAPATGEVTLSPASIAALADAVTPKKVKPEAKPAA